MLKKRDPFPVALADERRLDRRRFLKAAGATAVLALGGEWIGQRLSEPGPLEAIHLPDGVELPPGEARTLGSSDDRREILVVRLDPRSVVAFDRRCPHLGCPVLWSAERARFECPCHRAAFDARTGRLLFGPPRRGLTAVRVAAS